MKKRNDIYTKKKRSEIMSRVKSKNTGPEMIVRSRLHKLGYRFVLNRKNLPGSPDVVLPKYKCAIFVHGCFWHQHPKCKKAAIPKDNRDFWSRKLAENKARDKRNIKLLRREGWNVIIIWECNIKKDVNLVIDSLVKEINIHRSGL